MERKRRLPGPDGSPLEVTEVGFRATGEHWNEYLLDDGTVARVKLVVVNVYRVDGQTDPKGQPVYVIESNNVVAVSASTEGGA